VWDETGKILTPAPRQELIRPRLWPSGKAAGTEPGPAPRSAELTKLTELRAYRIWVEVGRPTGNAGEAVKEKNWVEAEKQINAEVEARAFQFWEQQGRPVGPEGEAVSKKNRQLAEIQLLQETEDEFRRKPIH
jgi:eukaryotic-like serine/threonine-protein kinase